jgi:hypothetical protein
MTEESREHPRIRKSTLFRCRVGARTFDSSSVNLSFGGAFLETAETPAAGTVVSITPSPTLRHKLDVVLLGVVTRCEQGAVKGIAVRWMVCATKNGLQNILDFLSVVLEIHPSRMPLPPSPTVANSPSVVFDFRTGTYSVPGKPVA